MIENQHCSVQIAQAWPGPAQTRFWKSWNLEIQKLGIQKKFKNQNVSNLKTKISNIKINQHVVGNTNTVYKNPMNSLLFVLKKLQKDKIKLNNNFYVFTGSSVGVVPILKKGIYKGVIDKIGSVSTRIS